MSTLTLLHLSKAVISNAHVITMVCMGLFSFQGSCPLLTLLPAPLSPLPVSMLTLCPVPLSLSLDLQADLVSLQ